MHPIFGTQANSADTCQMKQILIKIFIAGYRIFCEKLSVNENFYLTHLKLKDWATKSSWLTLMILSFGKAEMGKQYKPRSDYVSGQAARGTI